MLKKNFKITSESGIHARPAIMLVNVAMHFDCEITLGVIKKTVDLKSIMGLMSLGVNQGTHIEIACDGSDEEQALEVLTQKIYDLKLGIEA